MKRSICVGAALLLAAAGAAHGQTKIDLRDQTKNIDFSSAAATRPVKAGSALPATCTTAELYFLNTAVAGSNLYGCVAANTWAQISGSAGSGLPDPTGQNGKVLAVSGSDPAWSATGGDADGSITALSVRKIQGRLVSTAAPFNGQVLKWNAAANGGLGQWEPATEGGGGGGGASTVSAGTGIVVTQVGSNYAVSLDTAVVPAVLLASTTLDFPAIGNGGCAAPLTISMPGAVAGSALSPGWPAALEAGLMPFMRVSAAGTVSVWVCNLSGASVDPVSATYSAALVRGF